MSQLAEILDRAIEHAETAPRRELMLATIKIGSALALIVLGALIILWTPWGGREAA